MDEEFDTFTPDRCSLCGAECQTATDLCNDCMEEASEQWTLELAMRESEQKTIEATVLLGGGIYKGRQELPDATLILFDDPQTKSTLACDIEDLTVDHVKNKIEDHRYTVNSRGEDESMKEKG
jgi:hypothetical protein